ncbi:hypothetical protein CW357_00975 [Rummeliibacillus sp. TYF005]|uniref:hypothetical protein n=1 Tax=Rummeliibacillus sp. TYF005 TaxID=2058214 RepID=UPI000F54A627|nr:hypothetical protein [Rummeliibacillus sp. TYF005]RPJ97270.1 hypothetical protein CW357_00975 [Rummeliibacillus sp. TYF005]
MTKEKAILIDLGKVRIKEYDNLNVTVERLETVYNPVAKEYSTNWRFKGYSKSILSALEFIHTNELLIDKNEIRSIESYLKKVHESNAIVLNALKEVNA